MASDMDMAKLIYANGSSYKGRFVEGRMEGYGKRVWRDGTVQYEGEWKDGKRHGEGTAQTHDCYYYKGGYRNGLADGYGFWRYPNDGYCDREFVQDQRHGFGRRVAQDGTVLYAGEWIDDQPTGGESKGSAVSHAGTVGKKATADVAECARDLCCIEARERNNPPPHHGDAK